MSRGPPEPSAAVLGSGTMASRYAPIGEYGVIGDLYTVALVGMDGSIDFLCLPHFDSPSVFAALVDAERGGRFQIAPLLEGAARKQLYLPDTNVLLTRFLDAHGVAELSDFMSRGRRGAGAHPGAAGEDGPGRRALPDALRSALRGAFRLARVRSPPGAALRSLGRPSPGPPARWHSTVSPWQGTQCGTPRHAENESVCPVGQASSRWSRTDPEGPPRYSRRNPTARPTCRPERAVGTSLIVG